MKNRCRHFLRNANPGRRLYSQIYLSIVGGLLIMALAGAAMVSFFGDFPDWRRNATELAQALLPPTSASDTDVQKALNYWQPLFHVQLTVHYPDGRIVRGEGAQSESGKPWYISLPDGRRVVAKSLPREGHLGASWFFILLAAVLLPTAIAAYPLSRRMARRIENLQADLDRFGSGNFSTRSKVKGNDEVARLAEGFNAMGNRVETLLVAQKRLLANASHELRSPLARLKMAIALIDTQSVGNARRAEIDRNIAELDALIEELIESSRLQGADQPLRLESIDLRDWLAQLCEREGASLSGKSVKLEIDSRLLIRAVSNLIRNARIYAPSTRPSVEICGDANWVWIDVCDQGDGIPVELRERIFEPYFRLPGHSETTGGVGIGLSLVRQIMQAHGGDIECLDNSPNGCRMRLSLPRSPS